MWLLEYAVCAILLLVVEFIDISEALKSGDDGACVVKISSMQTRRISYSITAWRSGKRRAYRRYKNESYLTWMNRTICCQGWQHNSELDTCTAVCSTGCENGRCVAPSTCKCDPPLYLDPERRNACLTPHCDPPCVNSICTYNNICECENNARRYNKTHCAHCDKNYSINTDLTCEPVCDNPCVNGRCTAPNTCTCSPGFELRNFSCSPVCDSCVNSTCIAPETCSCFEGYMAVNNTACAPKCDGCAKGVCVEPAKCECLDGYLREKENCEPMCELECVNGYCSAPNVCSCNEGYVEKESGVCSKPCRPECHGSCDLEGRCDNGVCGKVIRFPGSDAVFCSSIQTYFVSHFEMTYIP